MELSKAWPEITLSKKISWIKHNNSYATLFMDYHTLWGMKY